MKIGICGICGRMGVSVLTTLLDRGHTLAAAFDALGDRQAAVCIELTKKFERISRGFLGELKTQFEGQKIKGEVTIVIAGNNPKFERAAEGMQE